MCIRDRGNKQLISMNQLLQARNENTLKARQLSESAQPKAVYSPQPLRRLSSQHVHITTERFKQDDLNSFQEGAVNPSRIDFKQAELTNPRSADSLQRPNHIKYEETENIPIKRASNPHTLDKRFQEMDNSALPILLS
eukprot:TRINITY_DN5409_c0_g2_i1.p1 TRINITY_DN5409_c0_g2~~TRINITY_DN5409_c0_g2_i1.p1  ORF type:complete len:161 (-),score=25.10 TRINITY_DN5409_c0_g2_i1:136-549(-)